MTFFAADQFPIVEMIPGIRIQNIAYGERIHLVRVWLEAGKALPTHQHPHEQVGTVVSGEFDLTIGDAAPRRVRAGEAYAIPGNTPHSAAFPVDTLVVEVFSPPRDDYQQRLAGAPSASASTAGS